MIKEEEVLIEDVSDLISFVDKIESKAGWATWHEAFNELLDLGDKYLIRFISFNVSSGVQIYNMYKDLKVVYQAAKKYGSYIPNKDLLDIEKYKVRTNAGRKTRGSEMCECGNDRVYKLENKTFDICFGCIHKLYVLNKPLRRRTPRNEASIYCNVCKVNKKQYKSDKGNLTSYCFLCSNELVSIRRKIRLSNKSTKKLITT